MEKQPELIYLEVTVVVVDI